MLVLFENWNGKVLERATVNDMVRQAVNNVLGKNSKGMAYVLSGDTLILATEHDGEVEVWESKITRRGKTIDPESSPVIVEV